MHLLRIGETILVRGRGQTFSSLLVTQHRLSGTLASVSAGVLFCHARRGCYGERHKSEQRSAAWRPARSTRPADWLKTGDRAHRRPAHLARASRLLGSVKMLGEDQNPASPAMLRVQDGTW